MTIREMQDKRKELGFSYQRLSELSGVPLGTVQKIFGGVTESPRYETIRRLTSALTGVYPVAGERVISAERPVDPNLLRDATPLYDASRQGKYTLEDYYRIREHTKVELIDGDIIVMETPLLIHQVMTTKLSRAFTDITEKNEGKCEVISPSPAIELMRGAEHDFHAYEPDIAIICDHKKLRRRNILGGPDLVVEVLSPSTRRFDLGKKQAFYNLAGVREYWVVDPDPKKVVVYPFEEGGLPEIYGEQDVIPIHIWPGESVDFKAICGKAVYAYRVHEADPEEEEVSGESREE